MAKPCPVCIHPSRAAIEQAILNRKSSSGIARDFGFTYTRGSDGETMPDHKPIARHRDQCMPQAFATAVREGEVESGTAIAERLKMLDAQVDLVIEKAKQGRPVMVGDVPLLDDATGEILKSYDWRLLLAAVREGRANAELFIKMSGRADMTPEDLGGLRQHLETPEGRKLLAELEALAMKQDDQSGGRS